MDLTRKAIIWDQFGAAMDTLEDALNACPDLTRWLSQPGADPSYRAGKATRSRIDGLHRRVAIA